MEIIIETCLKDFFIGLIYKNKLVDFILEENLIKKSDKLPIAFKELIQRNDIKTKDIKTFYVTNGPGSFMGIRAGLIFASTISSIIGSKIKTVNSMVFLSGGKPGKYYLDAKSNQSFFLDYPGEIKLVNKAHENSFFNYESFIKDPKTFLDLFQDIEPNKIKANYIKEPSVG